MPHSQQQSSDEHLQHTPSGVEGKLLEIEEEILLELIDI